MRFTFFHIVVLNGEVVATYETKGPAAKHAAKIGGTSHKVRY